MLLGNLNAKRDWGYAPDYVKAMWMMLQYDEPDDYVIASGEEHSVREFTELAFREVDIDIQWEGEALNERGVDKQTGNIFVEVSNDFYRPAEVDMLRGDASKARKVLGWEPTVSFEEMIKQMVKYDLEQLT